MQPYAQPNVLTVSELAKRIQLTVSTNFTNVVVRGEISGYTKHGSGHQYFTIKDEGAVLDAVCWRGTPLAVPLADGLEIIAYGRITTYPLRSRYQIVVEKVEIAGTGALQKLLKERFEAFKKKGYFEPEHKKSLPLYPFKIGVVSSPTGAVIQDILHRIRDRFPCHVVLWPVSVQGEGAEKEIVRAIHGFHTYFQPDVIIVARGGGSLEDLWVFNDETIIQAVYDATIPIVSAIGHETDTTLIDYVSDVRAPTPTGAAELCVPVRSEVLARLQDYHYGIFNVIHQKIRWLQDIVSRQRILTPLQMIEYKAQYLDDTGERMRAYVNQVILSLHNKLARVVLTPPIFPEKEQVLAMIWQGLSFSMKSYLENYTHHLVHYTAMLSQLDVDKTLKRGFCIPRRDHQVLTLSQAKAQVSFDLQFQDGTIVVTSR